MPCPKNKEGFLDEGEIYRVAFGKLKLPLDSLDDLTPIELYWIWDGHNQSEREYLYLQSFSIFYAVRSANNHKVKKYENPFEDKQEDGKYKAITQQERDEQIALLESIFNK